MIFFVVSLGGAIGSGARYLLYVAFPTRSFPVATLAVNVIGSFLMGLVMTWSLRHQWPPYLVAAVATGVLGGFTTYSAFNLEVLTYFQAGAWRTGLLHMMLMVAGCLLAGLAGYALGMRGEL